MPIGFKHGGYGTTEYVAWYHIIARCENKNCDQYHNYGGRGIKMCKRWRKSFKNFLEDMGHKPTRLHSIDRINNNLGYSKKNCRWSLMKEQQNNRRNNVFYKGEPAQKASTRLGGCPSLIFNRIFSGWSKKDAFTIPVIKNKQRDKLGRFLN